MPTRFGTPAVVEERELHPSRAYVRNEFPNPRAANDLTSWGKDNASATLTRSTTDGNRGSTSVQVDWNLAVASVSIIAGDPVSSQAMACAPGQVVYARASVKKVAAITDFELYLLYYDSSNTSISSAMIRGTAPVPAVGTWVELEGFDTAPANTAKAVVWVTGYSPASTASTFRVADVQVSVDPYSSVPLYVSGDQTNCSWVGTAHASASIGYADVPESQGLLIGPHQFDTDEPDAPLPLADIIALSKEMGSSILRFAINIDDVSPSAGVYDFSLLDPVIDGLWAEGIQAAPLFGKGPYWMSPSVPSEAIFDATTFAPDAAFYDEYGAVCAAITKRYENKIAAVEIWNEPNLAYAFWYRWNTTLTTLNGAITLPQATITVASTTGAPSSGTIVIGGQIVAYTGKTATTFTGCTGGTGSFATGTAVEAADAEPEPAAYTSLLTQCYDQIKAVSPQIKVLGGSLAMSQTDDAIQKSGLTFLRDMYTAGAKTKMDAIALHPYPFGASTKKRTTGSADWQTGFDHALDQVRTAMNENTDDAKPLWFTEFGIDLAAADPVVTDAQRAQAYLLLKGIMARDANAEALCYHALVEGPASVFDYGMVGRLPKLKRTETFKALREELLPNPAGEERRALIVQPLSPDTNALTVRSVEKQTADVFHQEDPKGTLRAKTDAKGNAIVGRIAGTGGQDGLFVGDVGWGSSAYFGLQHAFLAADGTKYAVLQSSAGQTLINAATGQAVVFRINNADEVVITLDQVDMLDSWLQLSERADPAAPAANQARLFCRDNGAGKTQLCVRFPTGVVQVLATEP